MGHYDDCYAFDEEVRLKKLAARPEYKRWLIWRYNFLRTKLSDLTVGELVRGLEKLEEYDDVLEVNELEKNSE